MAGEEQEKAVEVFEPLRAREGKCGLWESILFSKCEGLELKLLQFLSGIFFFNIE